MTAAPPATALPTASSEARAEFLLRLRARGLRDLAVLRVLEAVPREVFAPHRYADLGARDVALPIACGQTMSEPFLVAKMVETLAVQPQSRVLEIGAGSGYATAVLARLAREVYSLERYQNLAVQARARLHDLGITNATLVWGDGLAVPAAAGEFDRLIVHAVMDRLPATLHERLSEDAVVVHACVEGGSPDGRQSIVRSMRDSGGWTRTVICPSRLRSLEAGVSLGL